MGHLGTNTTLSNRDVAGKVLPAIYCAENGEGESETGESESSGGEAESSSSSGTGSKEEEEGGNIAGLKSALEKEREARKSLKKEVKELRDFREKVKKEQQTELENAQERAEKAESRVGELDQKLRQQALDMAIREAAHGLEIGDETVSFLDTDDALRLVDRSTLEVDEEDYSVDEKAVEKAVKELAKKKPHLVAAEGQTPPPSGSKFGGEKKDDTQATEDQLKDKYPALG